MKCIVEWLTVNINPPKLNVKIVARSDDKYGYGCNAEVFEFDSKEFNEDEAAQHLNNHSFIEWMELPE